MAPESHEALTPNDAVGMRANPDQGTGTVTPPKMPLWVKVFVLIGIAVALVAVIILVASGEHGPGRHFGSG